MPWAIKFLVWIMAGIGHAIGDHGGEERLNRAEGGDGEGRPHQVAQQLERNRR